MSSASCKASLMLSSIEVVFHLGCLLLRSFSIEVVHIAQISSFGTFPGGGGGWEESIIRLISAEAEAEALLV